MGWLVLGQLLPPPSPPPGNGTCLDHWLGSEGSQDLKQHSLPTQRLVTNPTSSTGKAFCSIEFHCLNDLISSLWRACWFPCSRKTSINGTRLQTRYIHEPAPHVRADMALLSLG